jgi:type II secretory pathway pseudopilin PulG
MPQPMPQGGESPPAGRRTSDREPLRRERQTMLGRRKGFTLIELLVVIAII